MLLLVGYKPESGKKCARRKKTGKREGTLRGVCASRSPGSDFQEGLATTLMRLP
jgi:hypothetical protein